MDVPMLARFDAGTHADRVGTLARLGRDHRGDPALAPLLDGLAATSAYHHHLALVAATAAGDTDPSHRLRSYAFAQLARTELTPDAAAQVIVDGSAEDRRALRRAVSRNGRHDLADAIVDTVRRELGDREAISAGTRFGWPAAWRARLRPLRAGPHADVAVLAVQVTTAPE